MDPCLGWIVKDVFDGHEARTVSIDDEGARHRITWRHGALYLLDHDLEDERALGALGGVRPVCVEIADAWTEALADVEILTLVCARWNPRADLGSVRAMARSSRARVPMVERWPNATDALYRRKLIANLPAALRIAYVVTAVDAIERAWLAGARHDARAFRDLEAIALRHMPRGSEIFRARVATAIEPAPRVTDDRSGLELVLPVRWLADVWARKLQRAEDGGLVVEVLARQGGGRYVVRSLRWEAGRPAFVTANARPSSRWPY